ncbi:MAG: glycosyltransferase [Bacteroidales bacterium]|jgi:glycosyltransferase involved in cell wall biosynthesis|nr:glycosyltransferase [Bacteroidales bacterium]
MRVLYITEDLTLPLDEGIKNAASFFFRELSRRYDTIGICKYGKEIHSKELKLYQINTNRIFLDKKIRSLLKSHNPNIIFYLPSSSATLPSFVRLNMLKYFQPAAKCLMISMQPKSLSPFKKFIIRKLKTDVVLTPSPEVLKTMQSMALNSSLIPLHTDLYRFTPIKSAKIKTDLRRQYKLPEDKNIIAHVGHINWGRNLDSLIPLQTDDNQVVIIGSSSTPIDAPKEIHLKEKLEQRGIIILDGYIPKIEEIYQLSDLYVFPVTFEAGSIGLPLSILEARACGIPVLTTEYGSVMTFLGDDHQGIYYSTPDKFLKRTKEILCKKQDFNLTYVRTLQEKLSLILDKYLAS